MITYYRVDERVIHGQTLNVMTRRYPCDAIIVVDTEIAGDPYFSSIFKGMTNIKVLIFNVEVALRKLPEAQRSEKNYFVIFKHPTTVAELIEGGFNLTLPEIWIGPQISRDGTTTFFPTMCLTQDEIKAMDVIQEQNVTIWMQSILNQTPVTWPDAKRKIGL